MRRLLVPSGVSLFVILIGLAASSHPPGSYPPPGSPPSAGTSAEDRIAFYSERDGNAEIYVMHADGSNQTRLTHTSWNEKAPNWSPDGSRLIYTSNRDGRFQVWMMNADGTGQHPLTSTQGQELASDWSPDGATIAFYSSRNDPNPGGCWPMCTWQIYLMNTDGSSQRRLMSSAGSDQAPRWSPDGSRILFYSQRAGNWDIYVVNADGTGEVRLTTTPKWEALPVWSPDGTKILYCTMDAGTYANRGIGIMNADGSDMRTIIPGSSRVNEDPVFSPDGHQIAFQSDRTGRYQIYVMNADGTDQHNISGNHANEYWPNWRPHPSPTPTPNPTVTPTPGKQVRRHLQRIR